MFDCLVAGDANVDILVDGVIELEPGTEKLASDLNVVLGGSSAITAFNLSRLGATVTFTGVIGHDLFGRFVEDKLRSGGVDLTRLQTTGAAKTGVTIWHSESSRRAGVTYAGTIAMLEAHQLTDPILKSARHLHVGAYFLQTGLHAAAPELFARAKQLGLSTSLDCNYDPAERWDSNLRALLPHVDVFFPNEDEALKITRQTTVEDAAREVATLARTVVVKRGADGVLVSSGSTQFSLSALPAKVVDTTGAGDSFNAGFLAEFLSGHSIEQCAGAGVRAAARSIGAVGGTAAFES